MSKIYNDDLEYKVVYAEREDFASEETFNEVLLNILLAGRTPEEYVEEALRGQM